MFSARFWACAAGSARRTWFGSLGNGLPHAPKSNMYCDERARLLSVFNRETLASSVSMDNLLHEIRPASSVIYDMRRHAAEKARNGFELARLAYEAHVIEHHCETTRALVDGYSIR